MNRRRFSFLMSLMICCCASHKLWGQDSVHPAAVEIRLRLLAFKPSMASEEIYVHDPKLAPASVGQRLPMRTYLNHESTTISLTSRSLVLSKSANASAIKQGFLADVILPQKCRSAVLIALPNDAGEKRAYHLLVVPDMIQDFPAGTFHVINLSRKQVRIDLEKKPWVIAPAKTVQIHNPPVRHGMQSGMKAYVQENGEWRRIASGLWPHPGRERVIQLLFEDPHTKRLQIIAFDDVAPRD